MKNPVVLHIDTEQGFRGGQQQALYLHREMIARGIASYFAVPKDSLLYKRIDPAHVVPYRYRCEFDILSGLKLARFARKHQINILHAHSGHALTIGIWTKLFHPSCKLIASRRVDFRIHGRWKYRSADKIVCISREIQRVMLSCNIEPERLTVIHSGVDLDRFASSKARRDYLPEPLRDKKIIGIVAALAGHKDYPNLLGAARNILDRNPDVVFVSLGDGPERDKVHALAQEEPLKSRFLFLGHRDDVGPILKSFDIFVMSSRKEGLGTSIIDAMAQGLPIVATDAGGIPEMIRDRENGILVRRQDSAALAEGLQYMLDHPDFSQKMAQKALEEAPLFSMQKMAEGNIELYREILR